MSSNNIFLPSNLKGVHFHFVGIKGTGMVALVELLVAKGAVISGSDVSERFYTDQVLEKLGIAAKEFSKSNIDSSVDYVVYSSAYNFNTNPDLIAAKENNIPCLLYSEALGAYSGTAFSAGICGVHGKTTTTGLTGTILKNLPINCQTLAGSIISSFGNSCTVTSNCSNSIAGKNYFVAETCEYQRHFMSFHPQKIILTSVESDHEDFYPTYNDILNAFVDYVCLLPPGGSLIYCADDKGAVECKEIVESKRSDIQFIPYGFTAEGDFKINSNNVTSGKNYFNINFLGDACLKVPGQHLVRNAAAATALSVEFLKDAGRNPSDYKETIKAALYEFAGGKRRSEIIKELKLPNQKNFVLVDDYGHHPTAVNTTLAGYREFYSDYIIITDFMSHTYSRTQALLSEFAQCFGSSDYVILNKIYSSARENIADFNITGRTLFEEASKYNKNIYYREEFDEAADKAFELVQSLLAENKNILFVTMGAGDNWKVGRKLAEKLEAKK